MNAPEEVNNFQKIPEEISLQIIIYAIKQLKDVATLSLVSKYFNRLLLDDRLWKILNINYFGLALTSTTSTLIHEQPQNKNSWNLFRVFSKNAIKTNKPQKQKDFFKQKFFERKNQEKSTQINWDNWDIPQPSDDVFYRKAMELLVFEKIIDDSSEKIIEYLDTNRNIFKNFSLKQYQQLVDLIVKDRAEKIWDALLKDSVIAFRLFGFDPKNYASKSESHYHKIIKKIMNDGSYGIISSCLEWHDRALRNSDGSDDILGRKFAFKMILGDSDIFELNENIYDRLSILALDAIFKHSDIVRNRQRLCSAVRALIQKKPNNERVLFIQYLVGHAQNNKVIKESVTETLIIERAFPLDVLDEVIRALKNSPCKGSISLMNTLIHNYYDAIMNLVQQGVFTWEEISDQYREKVKNDDNSKENLPEQLAKIVAQQQNQIETLTQKIQSLQELVLEQQKMIDRLTQQMKLQDIDEGSIDHNFLS